MKRQFKIRLIKKSLPESEAAATMVTSTPTSVVKPTTTTTKPSPIPVMMYNLAQGKFQEIHKSTKRFKEEEGPFTPNCNNPPMVQQPKAATAITSTAPLTENDTPWPNTITASTNLFDARASWPIPPYMDDVLMPTSFKTKKAKKIPPKPAAIPHTLIKPQTSKSSRSRM